MTLDELGDQLHMPADASCITCGYSLSRLRTAICPECGRRFDPRNASSFLRARRWQRWAKAPSNLECVLLAVLSVFLLWRVSSPAQWEESGICVGSFVVVPLWLAMFGIWVHRAAAARRLRLDCPECGRQDGRFRWLVAPICAVLVLSTLHWPWPLIVRFHLSRPAFARAAKDIQAGKTISRQWIGLYFADSATLSKQYDGRTTVSFECGHSWLDPVGFEYDPLPNHPSGFMQVEVAPGWFTFEH